MTTPVKRPSARVPGWVKALGATVVVLAVLFAGIRLSVLPGLKDLFGTETRDRSGPALLESIQDISRYDAASGNFQVVVDLEKDTKFLPDAVRGSRTLYVGAGTVDAYVDLGGLKEGDVRTDEERTRRRPAAAPRPSRHPGAGRGPLLRRLQAARPARPTR